MTSFDSANDTGIPDGMPAELNIMMGVHLLYWKTNEVMDTVAAQAKLSKNERSLLLLLENPKRMGVLAEWMQVLPSTVTALADELEAKGIIQRERSPEDRRAWSLRLTEKGLEIRKDIIGTVARMFAEVSGLTQIEMEKMSAQMLKIARNINANGLPEGAKSCQ